MTQEIAMITGRLDGARHVRGRTCTTSPSSIVPRRNAGNSVWDGNYLGNAKAAHQGPYLPSPPPPHPRTPGPGGRQSWPASQRHVPEEAVADDRQNQLHEALLNPVLELRVELQKTTLNSVSGENLELRPENDVELSPGRKP